MNGRAGSWNMSPFASSMDFVPWNREVIISVLTETFSMLVFFLIQSPLFPAVSSASWYWSCFVYCGLAYEIYSGSGPSKCVYCVVCYRVITPPYVKSVVHVFAYLYILDDDSEHPMDYETSLLPNVFPPLISIDFHYKYLQCYIQHHLYPSLSYFPPQRCDRKLI